MAIVDLPAALHEIADEARAAGLTLAAEEFEARCFAAATTSSEWLGEVGLAIGTLKTSERGQIPAALDRRLDECLAEVRKAWPRM